MPFAPSPGTSYVTHVTLQDLGATLGDYNPGDYALFGTLGQSCGSGDNESSTRRHLFQEAMESALRLYGNHGSDAHDRRSHADQYTEGYVSCEGVSSRNCYDGNAGSGDGCSSEVYFSPLGIRLGEV